MIVSASATISASTFSLALGANSASRTSSALRRVDIKSPEPCGSTSITCSRLAIVTRPIPDQPLGVHRLADHSERLGRQLAIGIDEIRSVEINGIDLLAADELCQVDDL